MIAVPTVDISIPNSVIAVSTVDITIPSEAMAVSTVDISIPNSVIAVMNLPMNNATPLKITNKSQRPTCKEKTE